MTINTYINGDWVGWEQLKTVYAIRKGFEQQAIEDQEENPVKHRIYGMCVYGKTPGGETYLSEIRFYTDKAYNTDEEFDKVCNDARDVHGDIRILAIHKHD